MSKVRNVVGGSPGEGRCVRYEAMSAKLRLVSWGVGRGATTISDADETEAAGASDEVEAFSRFVLFLNVMGVGRLAYLREAPTVCASLYGLSRLSPAVK